MLNITLTATPPNGKAESDWQKDMSSVYHELDFSLGRIINSIEKRVGLNQVLFVITSTGYNDEKPADLKQYRIPSGTFYINRTASLLNMYLGAIYGQGRYVEQCFSNEIYLNHRLIEQKRLSMHDILNRSQEFLLQNAGVADVYTSERLLAGNNDIQVLFAQASIRHSAATSLSTSLQGGDCLMKTHSRHLQVAPISYLFPSSSLVQASNMIKYQHPSLLTALLQR